MLPQSLDKAFQKERSQPRHDHCSLRRPLRVGVFQHGLRRRVAASDLTPARVWSRRSGDSRLSVQGEFACQPDKGKVVHCNKYYKRDKVKGEPTSRPPRGRPLRCRPPVSSVHQTRALPKPTGCEYALSYAHKIVVLVTTIQHCCRCST